MKTSSYQKESKRTLNDNMKRQDLILQMLLGIAGEGGEIIDLYKKHFYQGHTLDRDEVIEEIGDVVFYIANLCNIEDIDLGTVMSMNIAKLKKRYPDGFDSERSVNRE